MDCNYIGLIMKKEDVVWHEEDEYEVMKDPDGWTLVVEVNHFKGWMRYDVRTPDNYYLGIFEKDIYKAIDILNEEKKGDNARTLPLRPS